MNRKDFFKASAALFGGLAASPKPGTGRPIAPPEFSAAQSGEDFWKLVRDQFALDPDWTYLNFGGLGSPPLPVLQCFTEWTRAETRAPNAGHDDKEWAAVKDKLARILGPSCRRDDLALIGCATEGIGMIVNGLDLKKGDEVITSTHEHVAVQSVLLNRARRDGILIRLFEPDRESGPGNVERIARLVNGRTRLILVSHVTCTTGQRFPVREISALARAKGIHFALDGAQAPVCVPFDIVECGADFYTCSTHKWIMGPIRTGFLYIRPGLLDVLRPLAVGAYSSERYDIRKNEFVLHPSAQRFEYGTQNDALFFALGKALEFVSRIGTDRIWKHNHALAERFYRGLQDLRRAEILSPAEEAFRSAMITFRIKNVDYGRVNEHLAGKKIRVRPVAEGGVNGIRVSFHICNRDADVDKILAALKNAFG
jgi:selenocysteine lyase/cysteine desulfurase